MTFADLGSGLNNVKQGLKFAHFGWSSAPSGDYGVYSESDRPQFMAGDRNVEYSTHGYVDLFTRDDSGATQDLVEDYFRTLQETETFCWTVNTIQYEDFSRFIHVEWEVELA